MSFNATQTPTSKPSKSYAFDFKGKIAAKNILRFHQLSRPIGDFFALYGVRRRAPAVSKITIIDGTRAFIRCKINGHGGPGKCLKILDFIEFFVGQNQTFSRIVPYRPAVPFTSACTLKIGLTSHRNAL